MTTNSPSRKPLGCLLGIIGALVGFWLGNLHFQLYVQKIRSENPNAAICGNGAIAGMFFGLIGGGLAGMVIGKTVEYFRNRSKRDD
jgi:H+/Cl- antiporter ClcA